MRVLLLLVLLTAVPAPAAAQPLGELDVAGGSMTGSLHGGGLLRAYVDEQGDRDPPPGDLLDLHLDARSLHVTVHSRNFTSALGAAVDTDTRTPPEERSHGDADVHAVAMRGGYSLAVLPLDAARPVEVTLRSGCGTFASPGGEAAGVRDHLRGDAVEEGSVEGRDASYSAPVDDALRWDLCPSRVVFAGDLRLVLWEVDVEVRDDDVRTYRSGTGRSELAAGVWNEHRRQLVLDATEARLELEARRGSHALFLASPRVDLVGSLSLQDAWGRVLMEHGWDDLRGEEPTLQGAFTLDGAPGGEGRVQLTLSEPAQGSGDAGWAWFAPVASGTALAWSGLALLALLLAVVSFRRHQGPTLAAWLRPRASDAARSNRFLRASAAANVAVWADPHHGDGYVLRALARGSRRRWAAALRDHTRAHHRLRGHLRGLNAFEAARVCSVRGHAAEAAHWLAIAVRHDVRLLDEASMDPDFGRVAGHEVFRRILRGHLPDAAGA